MLTASQLRAARALTGLTLDTVAVDAGLPVSVVEHAEATEAHTDPSVTDKLRALFEAKGIVFLAAGEGDATAGPGVRLKQANHDEGIRPQNLNAANDG